jgi:hypothetical protein
MSVKIVGRIKIMPPITGMFVGIKAEVLQGQGMGSFESGFTHVFITVFMCFKCSASCALKLSFLLRVAA